MGIAIATEPPDPLNNIASQNVNFLSILCCTFHRSRERPASGFEILHILRLPRTLSQKNPSILCCSYSPINSLWDVPRFEVIAENSAVGASRNNNAFPCTPALPRLPFRNLTSQHLPNHRNIILISGRQPLDH